jgi:hypothetical protein
VHHIDEVGLIGRHVVDVLAGARVSSITPPSLRHSTPAV